MEVSRVSAGGCGSEGPAFLSVDDGGRLAGIDAVGRRAIAFQRSDGARRDEGACKNYQSRARKKKRDRLAHREMPFTVIAARRLRRSSLSGDAGVCSQRNGK